MSRAHFFAGAILTLVMAGAAPAGATAVPVTSCGQVVDGLGELTGNLDCTGSSQPAVHLNHASTLDLAGFTLSGGSGDGVECEGRCAVISTSDGGTIRDFGGNGIVNRSLAFEDGSIRVNHLTIQGNGAAGVTLDQPDGTVAVSKSTVTGNGGIGVFSPAQLRVSKTTVSDNGFEGVVGGAVQVLESLVTGNGAGVEAASYLKLSYTDILGNLGDGVRAGVTMTTWHVHIQHNGGSGIVMSSIGSRVTIQFAEISDNAVDGIRVDGPQERMIRLKLAFIRRNGRHGVVSRNVGVYQSRIDDNTMDGILAEPGGEPCLVRLKQYTITGNGSDASCGVSVACADVASCLAPVAISSSTVCGTSYDTTSGFPGTSWGVCEDD